MVGNSVYCDLLGSRSCSGQDYIFLILSWGIGILFLFRRTGILFLFKGSGSLFLITGSGIQFSFPLVYNLFMFFSHSVETDPAFFPLSKVCLGPVWFGVYFLLLLVRLDFRFTFPLIVAYWSLFDFITLNFVISHFIVHYINEGLLIDWLWQCH